MPGGPAKFGRRGVVDVGKMFQPVQRIPSERLAVRQVSVWMTPIGCHKKPEQVQILPSPRLKLGRRQVETAQNIGQIQAGLDAVRGPQTLGSLLIKITAHRYAPLLQCWLCRFCLPTSF